MNDEAVQAPLPEVSPSTPPVDGASEIPVQTVTTEEVVSPVSTQVILPPVADTVSPRTPTTAEVTIPLAAGVQPERSMYYLLGIIILIVLLAALWAWSHPAQDSTISPLPVATSSASIASPSATLVPTVIPTTPPTLTPIRVTTPTSVLQK